jgi:IS6 family transposase
MSDPSPGPWRHFPADLRLCAVRWYVRDALSSRAVAALRQERGVRGDPTTGLRWGQRDAPERDQRCRPLGKATHDSYRVAETEIQIKQRWYDLYRAVDARGATLDCGLSPPRDADAAERFFRQRLHAFHTRIPRVLTVATHAADPPAVAARRPARRRPEPGLRRRGPSVKKVIAQEQRGVKRRVKPGLGRGAFTTAQRTIQGYEAMPRLRKGQSAGMATRDVLAQSRVINQICGLAA